MSQDFPELPDDIFTQAGFCLTASKKDLPGWRIGLNWLCGVEMDDGDGAEVEIPQVIF